MTKVKRKAASKKKGLFIQWWKQIIGTLSGILILISGLWALDKHWVPREIHDIAIAQQNQTNTHQSKINEDMRRQLAIQGWQQQEFYWRRKEVELKDACRKSPRDPSIQNEYMEAVTERRRAEDEVRKLQQEKR